MVTDESRCEHCQQPHPWHPQYPHGCPLGFERPRRAPQPTLEEQQAQARQALNEKHAEENRAYWAEQERGDWERAKTRGLLQDAREARD